MIGEYLGCISFNNACSLEIFRGCIDSGASCTDLALTLFTCNISIYNLKASPVTVIMYTIENLKTPFSAHLAILLISLLFVVAQKRVV